MSDADSAANDETANLILGNLRRVPRDAVGGGHPGQPGAAGADANRLPLSAIGRPPGAAGSGPDPSPTHTDPDDAEPDDESGPSSHRRKRSAWKTALIVVASLALVCSGTTVALVFGLLNRYENKVSHEDILGDIPKPVAEPDKPTSPLNFLVLGSDSRAEEAAPIDDPDGSRSDTIMIVHVAADHKSAFIFSIPRDSYVDVPAGGSWKGGKNKINAAFAFGGAKLAAKTVYELTKIPLDGAMIVNFGGIQTMIGQVGTVHVCIPYPVRSIHTTRTWTAGCHDMGPDEAEDFMRQRKSVPGGDFGRIHDQQLVVKALADKISHSGMLTDPIKLDQLIVTAASALTLDNNMNLRDLAFTLKGIDSENIKFATTPYTGTMTTSAGSSVQLDMTKANALFKAVIGDKTTEWLAANPQKDPDAT